MSQKEVLKMLNNVGRNEFSDEEIITAIREKSSDDKTGRFV